MLLMMNVLSPEFQLWAGLLESGQTILPNSFEAVSFKASSSWILTVNASTLACSRVTVCWSDVKESEGKFVEPGHCIVTTRHLSEQMIMRGHKIIIITSRLTIS